MDVSGTCKIANLPIECIYNIFINMNIKDILVFIQTNKQYTSLLESRYFWIFVSKIHYNKNISSCNSVRIMKTTYINFYKTLCQNCGKRAHQKHLFYPELVCYKCQDNVEKYKIINPTKAKKEYYLTNTELSRIKSITEYYYYKSSVMRKNKKTYYLLSDVIDLHNTKFPDKHDYLQFIINKMYSKQQVIQQRLNKERCIIERFIDLDLNYNIIKNGINSYSQNRYKYFMKKKHWTVDELDEILKYCFQLYFTLKYTNLPNDNLAPRNFKWVLFIALTELKHTVGKTEFLNNIGSIYFKDDFECIYSKFEKNMARVASIKFLLETEYDNYFITNYSSIDPYDIDRLICKYIYRDSDDHFDEDLDKQYERTIIEEDILQDFFVYKTLYCLIMYSDARQRSVFEYRKEAYQLFLKNDDSPNNVVKRILNKYFG